MADVSPDHTDGLKKVYENSLGLCGFSKTEVIHSMQAANAANPAMAKLLPKLQFTGVTAPAPADMAGLPGAPGIPGVPCDLGGAIDPTGITGLFAQFMHFLEGMAAFPDAEQLLDPAIAGQVAEEAAKKLI
jgi:hypothetical protein